MTQSISESAGTILAASRKGFLRSKSIFKPYATTSKSELTELEQTIGIALPSDMCDWLLALGYGDIDEELSFRREWFSSIERGHLQGSAIFAQDMLGNFYAFDSNEHIFYLCRSEPVFAAISKDFLQFINELVQRDYKLVDWMGTLETQKYEW